MKTWKLSKILTNVFSSIQSKFKKNDRHEEIKKKEGGIIRKRNWGKKGEQGEEYGRNEREREQIEED